MTLREYDGDESAAQFFDASSEIIYMKAVGGVIGTRPKAKSFEGEGKESDKDSGIFVNDAALLFIRVSVWESSGEVPDPEALHAADGEAEEEQVEGKEGDNDDAADMFDGPTADLTGTSGYTQVYLVMTPAPTAPRTLLPSTDGDISLISRKALFRYGSWVYAGDVDFPVESLKLGDVPFVLPALQKQQGRLAFVSEANAFPLAHPLADTLSQFMGAVALLTAEMEDVQDAVAELAEQSVNAWINEEWAASFFELSFQPKSVEGEAPAGGEPGWGLAGSEVIAAKMYLGTTGVILHVVWWRTSLFCVLADNTDDVPLLDVAFPDVTARNRVVQVRDYAERTAAKLSDAYPGSPLPRALRVWEGRRKGVAGVGGGAAAALAAAVGGAEGAGKGLKKVVVGGGGGRTAAAAVAVAQQSLQSLAVSALEAAAAALTDEPLVMSAATALAPSDSSISPAAAAFFAMPVGSDAGTSSAIATPTPTIAAPISRAPHHIAPLGLGVGAGSSNRLQVASSAAESKEDAPWDEAGRPKGALKS